MRGVTVFRRVDVLDVQFQPALPMRGVTAQVVYVVPLHIISTRTPHAGSDRTGLSARSAC